MSKNKKKYTLSAQSGGSVSLNSIKLPTELKKLDYAQCAQLCRQIRGTLVKTVAKNGGHLASNLGTVELTLALHRVFSCPEDKIVWDIGHQSYTHKILTDRYARFSTLRTEGGISGYAKPSESPYDAFISGHSSNSISAAEGIAKAMHLNGDRRHFVIAVIGDGAFTGGLAYEGLNNVSIEDDNLIVILNHNNMSISKNVGAFARYLTGIRGNQTYLHTKKSVENLLDNTPVLGQPIKELIRFNKAALKYYLYQNTFFEDMGFAYLGPVDGHNLSELEEILRTAKRIKKPVVIHVNTVKGKGFAPAERNPGAFHGVGSFDFESSNPEIISEDSYSAVFGKELNRLASSDKRICAITAAMKYGTGLQFFSAQNKERFFDVGIAEQHAVTFAAGLAHEGKIPVFAVYSSFLQRAYDQLVHDNAIENTHIVLGIDHAGLVGTDGETHHGIFDVAFLSTIPNTTVFSPSSYNELLRCLNEAIYYTKGIAAVRYPKGSENAYITNDDAVNYSYKDNSSSTLAITYGRLYNNLLEACDSLPDGAACSTLKIVRLLPLDSEIISIAKKHKRVIIFEEGTSNGGLASQIAAKLMLSGYKGNVNSVAIDGFPTHSSVESGLCRYGLDAASMVKTICRVMKINETKT